MDWLNERKVAYAYFPVVIHGIKSKWKDQISAIYFGDLIKADLEPHVYYEIVDYGDYKLLVYNIFHRLDYSLNGMHLIRKWDSHHLDFEGWIKCIDNDGKVLWTATRSHYEMLFVVGDSKAVYIEAEGHAIKPDTGFRGWENQVVLSKDKFKYVNMKEHWKLFDLHIWPVFRRFHIDRWQEWNDWRVERKFGRRRTAGLLFRNPALFYRYAKDVQIVKGINERDTKFI